MEYRGLFPIGLFALLLLGGCAAESDVSPLDDLPAGVPLEIEPEAVLSVGVLSGDTLQEFDRVRTPFVFPDGRLVVPLAGSYDIRIFAPDGGFMERLGGRGEGPGEFVSLSAAWPRGDTIEALDSRARRMTRFLPDGTVEVISITSASRPDISLAVGPLGEGLGAGWCLRLLRQWT